MAGYADLVAVRISEVGAVVVGVVLRTQARRPFVFASVCERSTVCCINLALVRGKERHHLTVSRLVRVLVVGRADEEKWPRLRRRLPTCPRAASVKEPLLDAQFTEHRLIEGKSAIEVRDCGEDV